MRVIGIMHICIGEDSSPRSFIVVVETHLLEKGAF